MLIAEIELPAARTTMELHFCQWQASGNKPRGSVHDAVAVEKNAAVPGDQASISERRRLPQ